MSVEKTEHNVSSGVGTKHAKPQSGESAVRLRNYEEIKFQLAGLIREASSEAWKQKNDNLQREFQLVLRRLAEDRFYLTLAGQFSRGKTTLMNAMLGMDRLPTGIVPVTSVITAVSYNPRERVVRRFENSNLSHEVPLSELPEWITEKGNPGNQRKIEMAEVQLPAEILRRGAFFVDTPGLGSVVVQNTETTRRFLPQIDALVLVTSFEFPLSAEELAFLRAARSLRRRVFIVVNKLDLCPLDRREEVLEFIRSRVAEEIDFGDLALFAISASEALTAKLNGDQERLDRSQLPVFEHALVDYLIKSRSSDFLASISDRIESLLRACCDGTSLKNLEDRLADVCAKFLTHERFEHDSSHGTEAAASRSLKISSCFVCKRMADATFQFMSHFQYDLSHSRELQLFHASRSGFCSLHTREYSRLASPQGIASGYPQTLLFVAEQLRLLSHEGRLRADWKDQFEMFLPDHQKCQACQVVAETEETTMNDFVLEYADRSPVDDYLPCVCVRHLNGILQKAPETNLANRLLLHSATVLERTAENMERFALRHGGLHMELATDDALGSPEKGLNLLVGQPNVRPTGSG
jgi:GTP-binding protein EngB required for normal cell division